MKAAKEFFAPASENCWDFLFQDYRKARAEVERIGNSNQDPLYREAMGYYLRAANRDGHARASTFPRLRQIYAIVSPRH